MFKRPAVAFVGLALVAVLAGCGASAPAKPAAAKPAAAQPAPAQPGAPAPAAPALKAVTVQLSWLISGYDAPVALAVEKGLYRQAGFDVTIVQGRNASLAVDQVAKGGLVFGYGGIEGVVPLISKGAPVRVVAAYVRDSPMSFIYHPSLHLTTPRALIGKTIISAAGDQDLTYLPAVLATSGVSMKQLKVQLVSPSVYPSIYKQSANNVVIGFVNGDYTRVLQVAPDAKDKLYSAFGLELYDTGLVAGNQLIRQDPGAVRAFVAATDQGWTDALADPAAAVDATLKLFPQASPAVISTGLKYTLGLLYTPATRGHPLGWMAPADWDRQLQLIRQYGQLSGNLPATAYYTDAFVPGGA